MRRPLSPVLMLPLLGVLALPRKAASATPIGQWKFDEGSDTTAVDSSGSGHDGTLVAEQAKHTLFPGEPLGVQGSPEVEQHGSVVRGQRCGGGDSKPPPDIRPPCPYQQVVEKLSESSSGARPDQA